MRARALRGSDVEKARRIWWGTSDEIAPPRLYDVEHWLATVDERDRKILCLQALIAKGESLTKTQFPLRLTCSKCKGAAIDPRSDGPCPDCDGTGEREQTVELDDLKGDDETANAN